MNYMSNLSVYCLQGEEWKDIPNYESVYQASNFGRIRTIDGKITLSVKHGVRHWKGKILKPKGINMQTGYRVSLWKNKQCKDYLVARLVGFTFLGIPNDLKMTINHKDGNRFNNDVNNIEWMSLGDNIRHAFENNLHSCNRKVNLKLENKVYNFNSMAKASKFIGRNHGYLSYCKQKNKNIISLTGQVVELMEDQNHGN